ncbi:MAG: C4-dicarboxylate TRAP transporter substrate-binding protein [Gammaproteobacteria bacterium]|nr:C4-dicarboxylate TRAP transporter substrate-binding protein [Gammaproteobacteria bacterium]
MIIKMKSSWFYCTAFVFFVLNSGLFAANQIEYGSPLPPSHSTTIYGVKPWLEEIEKATGGDIKGVFHPAGAIASGKASLSALQDGLMDGGFVANIYIPDQLPVSMVITNLAFLSKNPLVTAGAMNEVMMVDCVECQEENKKNGIIFLGSYATPSYNLMCKKAVKDLNDLKGLKMRAAGSTNARWAKAMGGVAVTMANSHAYEALERGQLDCVIGSKAWLKTLSLWDLVQTTVVSPMGAFMGGPMFAFRHETWSEFTPEQKEIIIKLSSKYLARTIIGYANDEKEVVKVAASKGVNMVMPGPKLVSLTHEYEKGELKESVELAKKKGVKNPQKIADLFVQKLKKWEGIVAKTDEDPEKYAQALWDEVFSKVEP